MAAQTRPIWPSPRTVMRRIVVMRVSRCVGVRGDVRGCSGGWANPSHPTHEEPRAVSVLYSLPHPPRADARSPARRRRVAGPFLPDIARSQRMSKASTHSHQHDHDLTDEAHLHPGGEHCCSHHEIDLERWIVVYLVGGVLVLTTKIAEWSGAATEVASIPALVGALLLGFPLFKASVREIMRGRATSSTLASVAIIAAVATGEYVTGGFLAFILLIADQVVRRTASGAQRAIEQLVKLTPDTARIVEAGAEREVSLGEVRVGAVVRVRPGENLPVDGEVVTGSSSINQASLTGEAVPAEVQPGALVYAGTTNLTGSLDVRVTGVGGDTTIGKVTQLIREAESSRTPRQLLIEQVAAYFVPVAISTAGLVWYLMSQSSDPATAARATETAITVLIVVCPSALLLSSPTAMVAAFAAAARLGIMIKQTNYLESSANIDTVVLDKTGTITTGVFAVGRLAPADGVDGVDLLQSAADAEQQSNHPLAKSIIATARQARVTPANVEAYEEVHGRGVKARAEGGSEVLAGRAGWLTELKPEIREQVERVEKKIEGMTGVHVMRDGRYLGAVGLEDRVRSNAQVSVERLRELGVRQVLMFTGDRFEVAKRVGGVVGVDRVEAECLPEEKHDLIVQLVESGRRVMMVGDGINDGPSLATADVGVAMGLGGSDIATNSAGVALMRDDLSRVPFLIDLARKTRGVIVQNIVASIVIALIGLVLAATGSLAILFAVFYHFVGDVFVIANSFRLVRFGENYAESAQPETQERAERAPTMRRGATLTSPAGA
ncbi:MAG: cation-translocating P-type ATPase [Phycisphaerales bacterium]|nr:MAG: cation-translocating P-type ATPase [Phycisphaerales bacterium]